MAAWTVTDLQITDRSAWERLYKGYGSFYETPMPVDKLARVWTWLHDPEHELTAVVVRPGDGGPAVGLAHFRPFARPLHGSVGCFLDDLFVEPEARRGGAARALLLELRGRAARNGWDVVRWITRASNSRARAVYDHVAVATDLITYDMAPRRTGSPAGPSGQPATRAARSLAHTSDVRFRGEVKLNGKTATGIDVPAEVVEGLGAGKRPPVHATVAGYTYRTTIAPMGGRYLLGLSAQHRTAAGVTAGDVVDVELSRDTEPRVVELPADFAAALDADPAVRAAFDQLAYTHRKEHVRAVEEAKRPETRRRRIEAAVGKLRG
jgi:GNAT superfamily N-acetyltransferase